MATGLDIVEIASTRRESRQIDFKEKFDPASPADLCEVIKDIVAMANSGGGHILFGVNDDGSLSSWDCSSLTKLDPAEIADKITAYTGQHFAELEVQEVERKGGRIALMSIRPVHIPLVFERPGTYDAGNGKQKTAFAKGTIYFRHGAKSEPGTSQDIRQAVLREINAIRRSWLGNIRKIVKAPHGHHVRVLPPEVVESDLASATPIRIVDDPGAPAFRKIDPNMTHPHRQKEVIENVNAQLPGGHKITGFDVQCVRSAFKVDQSQPKFFYRPAFSSARYSQAFVDWMVAEFRRDPTFFQKARQAAKV